MHADVCICIHQHAYACTCMHIHEHACTCMNVHAYAWTCIHMHEHACICMNMHAYAWTCMHMYEHTCICTREPEWPSPAVCWPRGCTHSTKEGEITTFDWYSGTLHKKEVIQVKVTWGQGHMTSRGYWVQMVPEWYNLLLWCPVEEDNFVNISYMCSYERASSPTPNK